MSAPGYQSWAWTQQDWRTVQLHSDGSWSYARACGDGSTLPSGRKRLCLPRAVLDTLARSAEGRRIVREQARRKQGAKPGTRVQWHPKIQALVRALDARTPADRQQRSNPMPRQSPFRQLPFHRDRMGVVEITLGGNLVEIRPAAGTGDVINLFVQGSQAAGEWLVYIVTANPNNLYVGLERYAVDLDGDVMEDGEVFLQEHEVDEVDPDLHTMSWRAQLDTLLPYLD